MESTVENSQIMTVTVYPDRARVTLQGTAEVAAGMHRLLIEELPLHLERESVRVGGRGTAQVRILGVDIAQRYYTETPAVQARQLEQQIEQLDDQMRVLKDRQAVLAAQAKYLDGLRQATTEYAKGLSRGRTTVEDQARLTTFLQEQDAQLRGELRELDIQQRELARQLDKLRKELAAIQSARPRQRYAALIDVEVLQEGSFSPELSYVVNAAGWQPLYDVRLLDGNDGRSLEVAYLAQVTQNTGQDWRGVNLIVSTARPALNQRLPELQPWYVNVYVPVPPQPRMPGRARMEMAAAAAPAGAEVADLMMVKEMAEERQQYQAEEVVATVQDSGAAVSFAIPGSTDIPSDGSPHKTTINRFRLPPRLDYLAVPKHTDAVFRRVTVNNDSPSPLLAGPASLFAGDEFIGTTRLEYAASGEEIELLLGVEERITVSRELARRDVDKALLRDKRQLRYGYKIEVQNLLSGEARLELQDHIPVSRHEDIKVKLESAAPQPAERSDLNILEWRLTLPAGAKQAIQYDFLVEHPRSLQVVGLPD
jgi:uncharacterized protein (TIGR02231 family)